MLGDLSYIAIVKLSIRFLTLERSGAAPVWQVFQEDGDTSFYFDD